MWWLLLIAVNDLEYRADSVYATQEECVLEIDNSLDMCARVGVYFIDLPEVPSIETTVLPPMGPAG